MVLFMVTAPYTWLRARDMFLRRLPAANLRLETSSLALLAKGVTQKATKNAGILLAWSTGGHRTSQLGEEDATVVDRVGALPS